MGVNLHGPLLLKGILVYNEIGLYSYRWLAGALRQG
jgi:hypothetical protein